MTTIKRRPIINKSDQQCGGGGAVNIQKILKFQEEMYFGCIILYIILYCILSFV